MASKDEQKKKGLPTGAIVAIVVLVLALLGAIGWFMYSKKTSNANVGTPAPTGNAAVISMPSPTNVSAGAPTVNAGGVARTGAQV
jgi:flagellar basal body-associated protein FliL